MNKNLLKNYLLELVRPDDAIDTVIRNAKNEDTLKNLGISLECENKYLRKEKELFASNVFCKSLGGNIRKKLYEMKAENFLLHVKNTQDRELIKTAGIKTAITPEPRTEKEKLARLGGIRLRSFNG